MEKKTGPAPCDIFDTIFFPSSPESSTHPHWSHNHSFLINYIQKAHFESGLDPVGCWSQLFKNLLALLVSKTPGLFKDKDKYYHRLWQGQSGKTKSETLSNSYHWKCDFDCYIYEQEWLLEACIIFKIITWVQARSSWFPVVANLPILVSHFRRLQIVSVYCWWINLLNEYKLDRT